MPRHTTDHRSTQALRPSPLDATDQFLHRHLGPDRAETAAMLDALGYPSMDALIDETIPSAIRLREPLVLRDEVLFTSKDSTPLGSKARSA